MNLKQRINEAIERKRSELKLQHCSSLDLPASEGHDKSEQQTSRRSRELDQCGVGEKTKGQLQNGSRILKFKVSSEMLRALSDPMRHITQPLAKIMWENTTLPIKERKQHEPKDGKTVVPKRPSTDPKPPAKKMKLLSQPCPSVEPTGNSTTELYTENLLRSQTNKNSDAMVGYEKSEKVSEARRSAPKWYSHVDPRQNPVRGDLQQIAHVRTLISNCFDAVKHQKNAAHHFMELREKLHDMEFYPFLSALLIKKSRVLDSEGLSQIFDSLGERIFPWDIKADAEYLWRRWMDLEIDGDLMRGIETSKTAQRTLYKLTASYAQKKKSSNVVGENGLMNGQWWPNRICAWRDGAHGEQEAGIHGTSESGAFSVVLSAGYDDIDNGEVVEYCGTKSNDTTPTRSTSLMLQSMAKKQPLRVLRAASKKSKYAPKEGIRYDGLYKIKSKEALDSLSAMFRFTLERIERQDQIRWTGDAKRPTRQELKQRMIIRKLLQ